MGKPFPEGKKTVGKEAIENDFFSLGLYLFISAWLFLPYLSQFSGFDFVYAFNPIAAAWGVYFLGRRWISSWTPLVLSGLVYGFGPFALSFSIYHPLAGVVYAMIPWLFLPAAYWRKSSPPDARRFMERAVFSLLPFAAVFFLFWSLSQKWVGPYFLMPITAPMTVNDFQSLFFPLHKIGGKIVFSVYHAPMLLAVMGLFVLANVQKIAVLIPFAAGLVLCFLGPVLQVSPVVWAAFPILFLSLLSGLGFQSILYAGKADSKWIVACAIAGAVLMAFFGGLSFYPLTGREFDLTAVLYAAAAAVLLAVYYLTRVQARFPWGRWLLLTGAAAIDFILSARYVIEKIL